MLQAGFVQDTQKISAELESERLAGAGAVPAYIPSVDLTNVQADAALAVDISTISSSANGAQTPVASKALETITTDNPNYLVNQPAPRKAAVKAATTPPQAAPTIEPPDDGTNGWVTSATYTVKVDKDGHYVVTNPDGTTKTFESQKECEAYLAGESKKYGGCMVVVYEKKIDNPDGSQGLNTWNQVYKGGELVHSTKPARPGCVSAEEQANQWIQNQYYAGADMSYTTDYPSFEGLNGGSSNGELGQAIDSEMDSTIDGFDERDFIFYDENGYMNADPARLEAWYNKIHFLCGLLIAQQMLMEAQHEARDLVQEEMTGIVTGKGLDTATIVAKYVQNRLARVTVAFGKLLQDMSDWNKKVYDREVAKAKDNTDGCGDKTADFITGGQQTKEMLRGMRTAAEHYAKVMETMLALMGKTTNKQQPDSLPTDGKALDGELDRREADVLAQIPSIIYPGENDYDELDDVKLTSLRKQFYGIQTLRSCLNSIKSAQDEARNLVHQEMTEIGGRERNKNAQRLQQMENQHKTTLFESQINFTQQKMQLDNQVKYLTNQINMSGVKQVFNIIANIIQIVSIIFYWIPPLALALTVLSAGVRLLGSGIAHSMYKDYKPKAPTHQGGNRDTNTGNEITDMINAADNRQDDLLAQENIDLIEDEDKPENWFQRGTRKYGGYGIDHANEKFKQVNYKAIADIQKQLTAMQNLKRAILALYRERAAARKLVHMEMTGVGGREMGDFVSEAFEADFQQVMFVSEMLAFMLNEYKTALNMDIAEAKALANAITAFIVSVGMSVAGGYLGGAAGAAGEGAGAAAGSATGEAAGMTVSQAFSLGWSLGGAFGGLLGSYLNEWGMGSYGVSYGNEALPAYLQSIKNSNRNSTENRLSQLEVDIYEELLRTGISKDVGDGYWGLNGEAIAKLRSALGRIANLKNALTSLYSSGAEARNLVHQEMTGISGRQMGELSGEVNQAEFDSALKTFDYLTQYLSQRIEAQKRNIDAQKAVTDAYWKAGINLAVAGACVSLGMTGLTLMNPVMGLVNAGYDFIVNYLRSQSGYGALNDYNAARVAQDLKKQNSPDLAQSRLDQMEAETYAQISQDLVEQLGGGRWGINSGAVALLRRQMEKIYNVKDALAKLQAAEAEARAMMHAAMTGVGGTPSRAGQAFGVDRMVAMYNISSLLSNIQTIVSRHDQMNMAERAMWQALTTVAFSALNIFLAAQSAENLTERMKVSEQRIKQQAAIAEEQKPGGDRWARDEFVKKEAELSKQFDTLWDTMKTQQLYQFIASLAESVSTVLTGMIFDARGGSRQSKAAELQSRAGTSAPQGKGWAASVARMENSSLSSSLEAGDIELNTEAMDVKAQQYDEILRTVWSTIQSSVNYYDGARRPNPVHVVMQNDHKRADEIATPVAAQAAVEAQRRTADAKFNNEKPPVANTKGYRDWLDKLERDTVSTQKANQETEAEIDTTMKVVAGMDEQVKEAAKQSAPEGTVKLDLKTAREILAQARAEWTKAVKEYQQTLATVNSELAQLAVEKDGLAGRIASVAAEIDELKKSGSDDSKVIAKIKHLETKAVLLDAKAKELATKGVLIKAQAAEGRKKVEEAKGEVVKAAKQVNDLLSKAALGNVVAPAKKFANNDEGRKKSPYDWYLEAQKDQEARAKVSQPSVYRV